MPYFNGETAAQQFLSDGIEITTEQYAEIRTAKLAGSKVILAGGSYLILEKGQRTIYSTLDKSSQKIAANEPMPESYTDAKPDPFDLWNGSTWVLDTTSTEFKDALVSQIKAGRKAAEEVGVTLTGVRYAGSPEDRQALSEAIAFATDAGVTAFPAWKDSDNNFILNHLLVDVEAAYRAIGQNRMRLISLEGTLVAQVANGELTDYSTVSWV
jgi:hypothetical protein